MASFDLVIKRTVESLQLSQDTYFCLASNCLAVAYSMRLSHAPRLTVEIAL